MENKRGIHLGLKTTSETPTAPEPPQVSFYLQVLGGGVAYTEGNLLEHSVH